MNKNNNTALNIINAIELRPVHEAKQDTYRKTFKYMTHR